MAEDCKMNTKHLMVLLILMIAMPAVLAGSVVRTISGTTVTYTLSGFSSPYGVLIDESLAGGCTLSDGTTRYVSIVTNPETVKSIVVTVPSGGTCTISGSWDFGTAQHGDFTSAVIGTGTCTNGATQSCAVAGCAGTTTCSSGAWGACVKADPSCGTAACTSGATQSCSVGTCAGTQTCSSAGAWGTCAKTDTTCGVSVGGFDICQYMTWAKFASESDYCTYGIGMVIGGIVLLMLFMKK
jgi:hypothetical protein